METEVWARRGASSDKLNRPFCFCLSGRAEVSPWFCATSASLVQMFWTPQCISSIIKPQGSGRMIRLRGKHSCTLHAGHQNPTALLVMNKLSCRCRHGAGPTYSCGRRITLVCRGHHSVVVLIGSSAGGHFRRSLPNAPCGSKASGSGRGCFCTAGCPTGRLLRGKGDGRHT